MTDRTCWQCGRRGSRGYFQTKAGQHAGQWRCVAFKACEDRAYQKRWGGTS